MGIQANTIKIRGCDKCGNTIEGTAKDIKKHALGCKG